MCWYTLVVAFLFHIVLKYFWENKLKSVSILRNIPLVFLLSTLEVISMKLSLKQEKSHGSLDIMNISNPLWIMLRRNSERIETSYQHMQWLYYLMDTVLWLVWLKIWGKSSFPTSGPLLVSYGGWYRLVMLTYDVRYLYCPPILQFQVRCNDSKYSISLDNWRNVIIKKLCLILMSHILIDHSLSDSIGPILSMRCWINSYLIFLSPVLWYSKLGNM